MGGGGKGPLPWGSRRSRPRPDRAQPEVPRQPLPSAFFARTGASLAGSRGRRVRVRRRRGVGALVRRLTVSGLCLLEGPVPQVGALTPRCSERGKPRCYGESLAEAQGQVRSPQRCAAAVHGWSAPCSGCCRGLEVLSA